jgi:(p)ppGpp synthase/HD superfamily hydrolase
MGNASAPAHSLRYTEALHWAAELHRHQWRKGKLVPYIAHLIAVSGLVWEDGGTENQAIAERYGDEVADIVQACTDTEGPVAPGGKKEPWIVRKTRYIEKLDSKPPAAWLVTAADKAHNARDMVADTRTDPSVWGKFRAGLDGSAWYLWSLHRKLAELEPASRSVALLGESVAEILRSSALLARVPAGQSPEAWVASYLERTDTHPKG